MKFTPIILFNIIIILWQCRFNGCRICVNIIDNRCYDYANDRVGRKFCRIGETKQNKVETCHSNKLFVIVR